MKKSVRAVTWVLSVLALMAYSSSHAGVNKCTDASGRTVYSDQPCADNSQSQRVEIKNTGPQNPAQRKTTAGFDPVQYCRDGNRDLTDAEMTARMEQFSRSGYPGGQICCKDGQVSQCADLLKK